MSWFKGCVGKVGVTGLMLFRFACSMDRKMEPRLGSRRCRSGQLRWGRWRGMGNSGTDNTVYSLVEKLQFFGSKSILEMGKGG